MEKKPKKKVVKANPVTPGKLVWASGTGASSTGNFASAAVNYEVKRYGIDLLGEDFGREDVNAIARKVNEIIKKLDNHA